MDLSPIHDARSVTAQELGFAKFNLHRPHSFTCNNHIASALFQITAALLPVNSFAPPAVRSNSKTSTRTILSRKRRLRRRKTKSADSGDVGDYGFLGGDVGFFGSDGGYFGGDDAYGGFGGGNGGGGSGGKGWNFDRFGDNDWDESSWSSSSLHFIYDVIGWIVLSICVHFAFMKVVRSLTAGIGDAAEREKAPIASIC